MDALPSFQPFAVISHIFPSYKKEKETLCGPKRAELKLGLLQAEGTRLPAQGEETVVLWPDRRKPTDIGVFVR